ncbi:uncharacterized protein LOC111320416, partial [Stylophora pistillata]|uniref:uncharacterized protein LOC111320416 n=1 Tax=Stylophora pistillata TaxID=50429 RepID=UPI000C04BE74
SGAGAVGETTKAGEVPPVRIPLDEVGDSEDIGVVGTDVDGNCCSGDCGCNVGSCGGGRGSGGWGSSGRGRGSKVGARGVWVGFPPGGEGGRPIEQEGGGDRGFSPDGNEGGEGRWSSAERLGDGGPPPASGSPSGGGNGSNGGFPSDEGGGGKGVTGGSSPAERDDEDGGPPTANDCPSGEGNGGCGGFPQVTVKELKIGGHRLEEM